MPSRKLTILCVDDDPNCLQVRRLLLEAYGFNVIASTSPREGIALYRRKAIDAAVIDFQMPEMNGAELAKHLKSVRANTPVVILSGLPSLPEDVPAYHDRFFCKTEPGSRIANELKDLIALHKYHAKSKRASVPRRVVALSALAMGFVAEGVAEMRTPTRRRERSAVNLKGMPARA